jgi:hypothetical protein
MPTGLAAGEVLRSSPAADPMLRGWKTPKEIKRANEIGHNTLNFLEIFDSFEAIITFRGSLYL